jgi:hypothetical protein
MGRTTHCQSCDSSPRPAFEGPCEAGVAGAVKTVRAQRSDDRFGRETRLEGSLQEGPESAQLRRPRTQSAAPASRPSVVLNEPRLIADARRVVLV